MPSGRCVRGSKQGKERCVGVCWNLAGKKAEIKSDGSDRRYVSLERGHC